MHLLAIVLSALAGLVYCSAGVLRWRRMAVPEDTASSPRLPLTALLWAGFAAHSAALVIALCDAQHLDFAFGVLGGWAAVAALIFAGRFLTAPNRGLLLLPVGCMGLIVAVAAIPDEHLLRDGHTPAVVLAHIAFMSLHLAAMLIAGGAGGLWLLGVRQVKSASARAFRLPPLPLLERLTARSLVIAAALLMGGLVTGAAALHYQASVPGRAAWTLLHPTFVIPILNLALLVAVLGARGAQGLGRRGLAWAALLAMAIAAIGQVSLQLVAHG